MVQFSSCRHSTIREESIGDLALAYGINRMCFHSYIHQPRNDVAPGFTHSRYGTHFGRHNTWWPQAGPFVEYLARCQYLLQKVEHPVLGEITVPGSPLRFDDNAYAGGREVHLPPPGLGEHSDSIRAWLGGDSTDADSTDTTHADG